MNPMTVQNRTGVLLACVTAALLQGCVHNLSVSQPTLPADYRNAAATQMETAHDEWWDTLGDPELSKLMSRGLRENLDLEAAGARIAAARARMGIADSRSLPQLDASARSSREKMSENGLLLSSGGGAAFPDTYTLTTSGLDASWELDLFGAHAAERRKAAAGHREAMADRAAVRLSLTAEIARVYVEHIAYAQQLTSAREVLELSEQSLQLAEQQYDNGAVPAADVTSAELALEHARESVASLRAETEARRHAMGVLVGTGEYVVLPEQSPMLGAELQTAKAQISVDMGLPSDLLRRRPDIRQAEAQFETAVADRSIAVADQYPRFSILASGGFESLERGSLFESASRFWALAPQVSVPLFDGGRRKSVVKEREAQVSAATATYRGAVVTALADVEQAMIRHNGATNAMDSRVAALERASELLAHEQARFDQGDSAKPQLLAAQREYENHRQAAVEAKKQALLSLVTLYKALGGDTEPAVS
ncbi:efflux transporter outer membrane subunit [Steroidobacter sp.]|uniref:efflux transporter outer membrane subunit n=1 Tax=Steroidobacter sp. TaxID=1978227 RepID=UPI001A5BAA89|nr:efflux transporter outer membrane subunit [Steroidobacter sp.]MBL8270924.1 efflux transporter outer membrane subunit [Steroidobacter sp.]